jgi:hypothetical protein
MKIKELLRGVALTEEPFTAAQTAAANLGTMIGTMKRYGGSPQTAAVMQQFDPSGQMRGLFPAMTNLLPANQRGVPPAPAAPPAGPRPPSPYFNAPDGTPMVRGPGLYNGTTGEELTPPTFTAVGPPKTSQ